jgi:hypothetical protein
MCNWFGYSTRDAQALDLMVCGFGGRVVFVVADEDGVDAQNKAEPLPCNFTSAFA